MGSGYSIQTEERVLRTTNKTRVRAARQRYNLNQPGMSVRSVSRPSRLEISKIAKTVSPLQRRDSRPEQHIIESVCRG